MKGFSFAGHPLPPLPTLATCAGDTQAARVNRRIVLGRELSAALVRQACQVYPGADLARVLGLRSRQGVHHWTDPTRPGPALSYVLAAPRAWSGAILLGALARLDVLTPSTAQSPQQLIARVVAGAAQAATVLDRRDLDRCTSEELDELAATVAAEQGRLAQIQQQIAAARERKGLEGQK